jgi:hypothetical protein
MKRITIACVVCGLLLAGVLAACSDDSEGTADLGVDQLLADGPAQPDGAQPDGTTPDGATPDGATPDGATPDGATPDGTTPDSTTPDGPVTADAGQSCTFTTAAGKTINLWGRVREVTYGEDIKVREVTIAYTEDLRVQLMTYPPANNPTSCGKWYMVTYGEDFKIRTVTIPSTEDLKIRYVTFNPGLP